MTNRLPFIALLVVSGGMLTLPSADAAPLSQQILPAATNFSLSITNGEKFNELFASTGLGRLLSDPVMKPFLDDLPRQLRQEATGHPLAVLWIDLGLKADDLRGVSNAEACWALVQSQAGRPCRVFIADVTGRQQEVNRLKPKIVAAMREQNAREKKLTVAGTILTVYEIPSDADSDTRKLVWFQQDDRLVLADDLSVAKTVFKNLTEPSRKVLANQSGYQAVIKQCEDRANGRMPDAVLFFKPVDLGESLRDLSPVQDDRADDGLAIVRKHKFDAISAVGCFLVVGDDAFDFQAQIAIHAPQPWSKAMRMARFPNEQIKLPEFVRADVGGVVIFNVDFLNLAKYLGPLFDDVYGEGEEGLYEDLKNTLLEDPDGPQIDIDREIFGRLSPQTILLARDELPVTPDSGQRLIAFSTSDEAALQAVVEKVFEADPNSEAKKVAGVDAFFSYLEDDSEEFGEVSEVAGEDRILSFITCVANGQLMFATDTKILEDALKPGKPMADNAEYKALDSHLDRRGDQRCVEYFGKLQELLEVNYELSRQGKKPSSAKSFKGLLNNIAAGEPPELEELTFDGSKLPDFALIRKYLGIAELVGITTDGGWYLEGVVEKQP